MALRADFARTGSARTVSRTSPTRPRIVPRLEGLEDRVVPYAASGNFWPDPQLVTISFVPDGANLGGVTSNLFATFNARFGSPAAWQNVILKAAQTWAQAADINFTLVADSGADSGSGDYQQGDPSMGDIRIGGFSFENSSLLALGYQPPSVNNFSVAGDIGINTAQIFNINSNDYDLFTVVAHEIGHALGLDHSTSAAAIMYSAYAGVDSALGSDDIAGIRAIYGPRQPDTFDAAAFNGTFATASDIGSQIDADTNIAQLTGLDITATGDVDFYKFTAPDDSSGTMTIRAQSSGLSLLAPSLRVYNANQQLMGIMTGSGYLGSTPTLTLNVTPGTTYYVRVAGANSTAFGTGAYALTVNLGDGSTPTAPSPDTTTPNGDPINGGGGIANRKDSHGVSVVPLLVGVDRLVSKLPVLGRILGRIVDPIVSKVIQLPFVDGYEIATPDVVAFPVSIADHSRETAFRIDVSAITPSSNDARSTVAASPRLQASSASPIVFGQRTLSSASTALEILGSRQRVEMEPIPASVSAVSSSPNQPTFFSATVAPQTATKPSINSDRQNGVDVDDRSLGFLSMLVVAVGLNPPVSADERRRSLVRS